MFLVRQSILINVTCLSRTNTSYNCTTQFQLPPPPPPNVILVALHVHCVDENVLSLVLSYMCACAAENMELSKLGSGNLHAMLSLLCTLSSRFLKAFISILCSLKLNNRLRQQERGLCRGERFGAEPE